MKTSSFQWLAGGLSLLLLSSVALAEPATSTNEQNAPNAPQSSQSSSENAKQQQKDSANASNNGTANTTKSDTNTSASPTPSISKTAPSPGGIGRKLLNIKKPKIRLGKRHRRPSTAQSQARMGGASPQAGLKDGAGDGSGNATQGNFPHQQGNQTENNQNNSQNNKNTNVSAGTALMGLVNVNVQNVNLNVYKVIDVHNVLNNSQIEALTQKIQNSPGAQANQEILNNLLQNAQILKDNQVVVGVLSSMKRILVANKTPQNKAASGNKAQ